MITAHIACSLLSYAAFLTAFVSGMLFLVQERQLKRKTMGWLFHRLPPLDVLDRANFLAIGAGFWLLSTGTVLGFLNRSAQSGRWWSGDPKEWLTVVLWGCYLMLWLIRLQATLRGRRVALLSMLGFGLVLFSALAVGWLVPSSHPFPALA